MRMMLMSMAIKMEELGLVVRQYMNKLKEELPDDRCAGTKEALGVEWFTSMSAKEISFCQWWCQKVLMSLPSPAAPNKT